MQKIVDYVVIRESHFDYLKKRVLDQIAADWQTLGGVSVVHDGIRVQYVQAMVRYQG